MFVKRSFSFTVFVLAGVIALSACGATSTPVTKTAALIVKPTIAAQPPAAATLVPTTASKPLAANDVLSVVMASGKFKTLLAALNAAGMTETLSSPGPFTLLAPTDDAFAKLPKSTLADLLNPANKKILVNLLANHLVTGKDTLADLSKMTSVMAQGGAEFAITSSGSVVSIGNAKIVIPNVSASNGAIQGIDTVLGIVH